MMSAISGDKKRKTSSAELVVSKLNDESRDLVKKLLANQVNSILDEDRERVSLLFAKLDGEGNGLLTKGDFEHAIPAVHNKLQWLWNELADQFDYNSDGIIEPYEFLAYFVLRTLCDDSASMAPTPDMNMGNMLLAWEHAFQSKFAAHIDEFEADLAKIGESSIGTQQQGKQKKSQRIQRAAASTSKAKRSAANMDVAVEDEYVREESGRKRTRR